MELIDKYKPQALEDLVIGNEEIKLFLEDMLDPKFMRFKICFVGNNGTGKSTIAELLPKLIEGFDPEIITLIGEEKFNVDNALDLLKNINNFGGWTGQKYQYVAFNEIDKVKTNLAAFWQMADKWESNVLLIATANNYMNIDKCLRSRFKFLDFEYVKSEEFLPRAMFILEQEGVHLTDNYVSSELYKKQAMGDIRKYMDTVSDLHRNALKGRIASKHFRKPLIKKPTSLHLTLV